MTASQQQHLGRGFMQSQDKALTTGFQSIKGFQRSLTNQLHRRICLSKRCTHTSHLFDFIRYINSNTNFLFLQEPTHKVVFPCRNTLQNRLLLHITLWIGIAPLTDLLAHIRRFDRFFWHTKQHAVIQICNPVHHLVGCVHQLFFHQTGITAI